jgi:hypothetical protein
MPVGNPAGMTAGTIARVVMVMIAAVGSPAVSPAAMPVGNPAGMTAGTIARAVTGMRQP